MDNREFARLVCRDQHLRSTILTKWKNTWAFNESVTDCWLCPLKPSKAQGYCQGSYDGHNKFALVHVVAAWEHTNGLDISHDTDASHLCGNATCFNPLHISVESKQMNQSRRGCIGYIVDMNNVRYLHCQHVPPCLKTVHLHTCICLDNE
jgi:hypothetical protein